MAAAAATAPNHELMGSEATSAPPSQTQAAQSQLENVKVAVRLRPFTEKERQRNTQRIVDIEQNTVALYSSKHNDTSLKKFTFDLSYWSHDGFKRSPEGVNVPDKTHPNCTKYVGQERVFEDLGVFLLQNALQGYNSALLAYGQTGSGKSYTVSGYGQNEGILPRFARALFVELDKMAGDNVAASAADNKRKFPPEQQESKEMNNGEQPAGGIAKGNDETASSGCRYEVHFSMFEIYNEVVRDLLAGGNSLAKPSVLARRGLKVREHPKVGFFVEALSSYLCANKDEIEQRIGEGQVNKSIAATSMNETSSRGHTIYEFRIKQYKRTAPPSAATTAADQAPAQSQQVAGGCGETVTSSVVQLVDLAGSERLAVHVTGQMGGDSFIGSRSSSPYPQGATTTAASDLQQGGGGAVGSSSRGTKRARSMRPSQPATPASASSTSSSALTTQQQVTATGGGAPPPSSSVRRLNNSNLASSASPQHHQQRFKESVSINQSLSALGNCIQVMSQNSALLESAQATGRLAPRQAIKIPYRDSVLTKLLNRCCLSGNSKVVIIATLSPAEANFDDTLSTLRFADRAKQIRTHAVVNRMSRGELAVGALQKENERLKQMIDGRVTRSDDSSQTSNFDDTENMIDNFNGPKKPTTSGSATTATTGGHQGRSQGEGAATTPLRSRTTIRRTGQPKEATRGGSKLMRHQTGGDVPKAAGSAASGGGRQLLANSASNPALAEQMRRLVSPAAKKLTQSGAGSANDDDDQGAEDEGDSDETERAKRGLSMKKSRSLAALKQQPTVGGGGRNVKVQNGAAEEGAGESANYSLDDDEIELAAGLLDEIDLNDLGDIDEGLLSPDSDDSFAALAEEGLSNEDKIGLLNRLLSNSNVANKIREQYENQTAAAGGKRLRPRRSHIKNSTSSSNNRLHGAGGGGISRVSAISSNLKQFNPYLSNLNPDEQLTGMITYIIKLGEMVVGKNNECDILLYGPELRGRHAKITRVPRDGVISESTSGSGGAGESTKACPSDVYIEPILPGHRIEQSKGNEQERKEDKPVGRGNSKRANLNVALMVNGALVSERTQLHHCDRLLFGSNAYFVFIDNASTCERGGHVTVADLDMVTYDMAHNEVLRKVMSEAQNEAMIREINDYTHRPGTGKHRAPKVGEDSLIRTASGAASQETVGVTTQSDASARHVMAAAGGQSRLTRSMTIHSDQLEEKQQISQSDTTGAAAAAANPIERQTNKLLEGWAGNIGGEADAKDAVDGGLHSSAPRETMKEQQEEKTKDGVLSERDENYRVKLMEDTYEYAMPVAEVNAIAKEMAVKVSYGLKILTGEEQLPEQLVDFEANDAGASESSSATSQGKAKVAAIASTSTAIGMPPSSTSSDLQQQATGRVDSAAAAAAMEPAGGGSGGGDLPASSAKQVVHPETGGQTHEQSERELTYVTRSIKPESLDVAPALYVQVHLEELNIDFYWSKAKFQARRFKMLELYGALDVGGKSGLVEYLIEQSKYQGDYMIDPFIDDPSSSNVLIGHAQVSLRPLSHMADLREHQYDVVDLNDDIVGRISIRASPCEPLTRNERKQPQDQLKQQEAYREFTEAEMDRNFVEDPHDLLGKRLSFSIKILRYHNIINTNNSGENYTSRYHRISCQYTLDRDHSMIRTAVGREIRAKEAQAVRTQAEEEVDLVAGQDEVSVFDHSHLVIIDKMDQDTLDFLQHGFLTIQVVGQYKLTEQQQQVAPTLITTIINSIQKYKYKMEQESSASFNYSNSIYANSDSAKSQRIMSSGGMMNSNSGASSVASTSATVNLFDQQNEYDDNLGSMNGLSQENIIDMILTKRKLDRAENQLHYLKRTINIAEHYNKKHIPVKAVKKLLNSYGHELESGSFEEMAVDVNTKGKNVNTKHSNCIIQ